MIFFLDFKAVWKFLNFEDKPQDFWELSSEKKQCLTQSRDFVIGETHHTNQYHSWLGHEDKGQESKSDPKENTNPSSRMAEYQSSSQMV